VPYWYAVYHSRSKYKLYQERKQATKGCPFCDPNEINYRLREETEHMYIVPNQTKYEVWEQHKVIEHLLLIPKRHVSTLGEFTDTEVLDMARLAGKYEDMGYSVYSRANVNPRRSVSHQHTHLVKIDPKSPKLHFYLKKPYVMVNF